MRTWIYAFGIPTSQRGPVKIGRTVHVEQRLHNLQRGCTTIVPDDVDREALQVLFAIEAEPWMERRLHLHFHRYRVCGEWFALNPAVVPRELKMAMVEIRRDAERRSKAAPAAEPVTPQAHSEAPLYTDPAQHMRLYREWIEAGFTEDQALRMVVMMASQAQT